MTGAQLRGPRWSDALNGEVVCTKRESAWRLREALPDPLLFALEGAAHQSSAQSNRVSIVRPVGVPRSTPS